MADVMYFRKSKVKVKVSCCFADGGSTGSSVLQFYFIISIFSQIILSPIYAMGLQSRCQFRDPFDHSIVGTSSDGPSTCHVKSSWKGLNLLSCTHRTSPTGIMLNRNMSAVRVKTSSLSSPSSCRTVSCSVNTRYVSHSHADFVLMKRGI